MNRHQRRQAAAKKRRPTANPMSREEALRFVTALAETDETVSGATLILPGGEVTYVDGEMLRRGGQA
jgi:hypothetical protein